MFLNHHVGLAFKSQALKLHFMLLKLLFCLKSFFLFVLQVKRHLPKQACCCLFNVAAPLPLALWVYLLQCSIAITRAAYRQVSLGPGTAAAQEPSSAKLPCLSSAERTSLCWASSGTSMLSYSLDVLFLLLAPFLLLLLALSTSLALTVVKRFLLLSHLSWQHVKDVSTKSLLEQPTLPMGRQSLRSCLNSYLSLACKMHG